MSKLIDLTNQKFGRLLVLERAENHIQPSGQQKTTWKCLCDCGKVIIVLGYCLKSGHTKSCGCYKREKTSEVRLVDLIGKKFGRLTVIKRAEDYISPKEQHSLQWLCKCDCGKVIIVLGNNLGKNHTQSCGCLDRERMQGEMNPNWKGGTTSLNDQIRTSTKYSEWRTAVFERDSYTCQVSGEKGGYLEIHHIKPFSTILEENSIETFEQALECEELWNLSNGVTLKEEHHRGVCTENDLAFHKIYRTHNFMESNFYEWVHLIRKDKNV